MFDDGRINYSCEGTREDVRSIARYIITPKQDDLAAGQRHSGRNWSA